MCFSVMKIVYFLSGTLLDSWGGLRKLCWLRQFVYKILLFDYFLLQKHTKYDFSSFQFHKCEMRGCSLPIAWLKQNHSIIKVKSFPVQHFQYVILRAPVSADTESLPVDTKYERLKRWTIQQDVGGADRPNRNCRHLLCQSEGSQCENLVSWGARKLRIHL